MIEDILRKIEKHPGRPFYETALKAENPDEFLRLKRRGLLSCIQPDSLCETYSLGQSGPVLLVNLDNRYWPISDRYSGKDFLDRSDLIKYSFSLETFARELAAANGFSGMPERLHRRLYYAGEDTRGKARVALILALIDQEKKAEDLFLGLPNRLPGYDHFVVVTPTFQVGRLALRRQLEALNIHVIPLESNENLKLDLSQFTESQPQPKPGVILNARQEEEFAARGYKCRYPIVITSEPINRRRNKILVNGFQVLLGDSLLALFLRLVVGLQNSDSGAVTKAGLRSGGFLKAGSEDQTIGHLRASFAGVLGDISPQDFIESYSRGKIRLSTHPDLIKYDKEKLRKHTNAKISKIAERLR